MLKKIRRTTAQVIETRCSADVAHGGPAALSVGRQVVAAGLGRLVARDQLAGASRRARPPGNSHCSGLSRRMTTNGAS